MIISLTPIISGLKPAREWISFALGWRKEGTFRPRLLNYIGERTKTLSPGYAILLEQQRKEPGDGLCGRG
jgi:hypothetical protein